MRRIKREPVFYDSREARDLREQMRDRLLTGYPSCYANGQLWMPDPESFGRINNREKGGKNQEKDDRELCDLRHAQRVGGNAEKL